MKIKDLDWDLEAKIEMLKQYFEGSTEALSVTATFNGLEKLFV